MTGTCVVPSTTARRPAVAPVARGGGPTRDDGDLAAPGASRARHHEAMAATATGLLVALATWARFPALVDSLWAEDATVFLRDARTGAPLAGLFGWYEGYQHLAPRLISLLATAFGLRAAVQGGALLLTLGAGAALVHRASAGLLRRRWLRAAVALAVALVPVIGQEAIGSIANLQFFLVYFSFWALVRRPASFPGQVAGLVVVTMTAASSPLAVVLLPLAGAGLVARRRRDRATPAAFTVVMGIHLLAALVAGGPRGQQPQGTIVARVVDGVVWGVRSVLANAVPGMPTSDLGALPASTYEPSALTVLAGAAMLAAMLVVAVTAVRTRSKQGPLVPRWGSRSALAIAATGVGAGSWVLTTLLNGPHARYAVVPALALVVVLAALVDAALDASSGWVVRGAVVVLAAGLAAAAMTGWAPGHTRTGGDYPLRWSDTLDDARDRCPRSPAPPATVEMPVMPPGWSLTLPCEHVSG
jgi:hypothetical protein